MSLVPHQMAVGGDEVTLPIQFNFLNDNLQKSTSLSEPFTVDRTDNDEVYQLPINIHT
jgi:hypothetical protein